MSAKENNTNDKEVLYKIVKHCDEILGDAHYVGSIEALAQDNRTFRATTQSIAQIGELSKRLSDSTIAKTNHLDWKGIRGIREMIVHDYAKMNINIIWQVMTVHVLELKQACQTVLDTFITK